MMIIHYYKPVYFVMNLLNISRVYSESLNLAAGRPLWNSITVGTPTIPYCVLKLQRKIHFTIRMTDVYKCQFCSNIVRGITSRRLRWAGHVVRMEEGRRAFKILTGKPTGKKPLGMPRHRRRPILEGS